MMGYWGGLCSGFAGYNPVGAIVGWLVTIGLIAALVLLIVRLACRSDTHAGTGKSVGTVLPGGSAREVLQLRYARGEITREQYLQMRDDLV
jgi:putative membrane protein